MAQKCVHKGCGKVFTDPEESCIYHPGPPEFHEGQKGWKCCKPRVLTFDEFLAIPPCTTGKHSVVDDTPTPEPKPETKEEDIPPPPKPVAIHGSKPLLAPTAAPQPPKSPAPAPDITEESDPEGAAIPNGATCKRRGCGATYYEIDSDRDDKEECVHHPGIALFHEGSKGWTCCKRRVLEFDEFLKIEGCKKRKRHLFVGQPKDATAEEKLDTVRHDFYQTASTVIVSMYLKKIDKSKAKVEFTGEKDVTLDLPTSDGKRYEAVVPLFGVIDTEKSQFKIMGTKLELTLVKKDGASWPMLRSDERSTGEIIQVGRAGRA